MTLPEHLFFDLDGTITDPAPGILGAVQYALSQQGLPVPAQEELSWVIGPPLRKSFPKLGVETQRVEEAIEAYRVSYGGGGMYRAVVYAGMADRLRHFRASGHRLSVVTAKPHVFAKPIVAHFGLIDLFDAVYGPEEDGTRDHKGDLIRHILDETGIPARDVIMIGDRANDIIAAKENAMPSIGVLWGFGSAQELEEAGAHKLVSHPHEIGA
jgi:phosphoglycolate phosphatase